jgi:RNA polymerase sigma factor (sigma-70 family)
MSIRISKSVLREVRALFDDGAFTDLSDRQLLSAFLDRMGRASEAAFGALVRRHGSMVYSTCRRILRDSTDADDAFQATFLILVRRAASICVDDSLGPWLHGVSVRVARRARLVADRKARRECSADGIPDRWARDVETERELRDLVDEGVAALPARYRSPIVYCYLEGLAHEEAARRIGCPVGTVRSRLARGRESLRKRLQRRAFSTTASAIAAALTAAAASSARASIPQSLAKSTISAGARLAGGRALAGTVSDHVLHLVNGAQAGMNLTRWTLCVALACATVLGGASLVAVAGFQSPPRAPSEQAKKVNKAAKATQIKKESENSSARAAFDGLKAVVVKTDPPQCAQDVDPATTAIQVTFSKDMIDGDYSIVPNSKDTEPEIDGKPRYDAAQRMYSIPVKLQPGRTYCLWLNTVRFGNFKDSKRESAVPYCLMFRTSN